MPENKTISCSFIGGDQAKKNNATSQALVLFGAPKEAIEIFHENKMTNTEGVNEGIYFSYPCRRQSCALVNIPAPCVNKVISHIENVESKIQEHLKRFETSLEEWSRTSSTKEWKEDWSIATPMKEVKPEEERDERCPELKQEMEILLSEAIHLIKSLETDRAEAEEALKRQKSRKKKIHMKIDSWSIWRLQEIPLAVQKEHEAYLRDIVELRWHLDDRAYQLKHFEEQKVKLEEANAKLQADTDYMNARGPLINSKQNQELEALKELYLKKFEVMELYKQIQEELAEAIENSKNAKLKAKQMKQDMEKDIHNDEASLEAYKREIDKLNSLHSHYDTAIENVNVSIEENEEVVTEVLRETKTSRNELSALSKMLDNLKKNYDQLAWKRKGYEKEYLEGFNNYYATKQTWDIELSNVAKDLSDISIAYTHSAEENRKLGIDIETMAGLINGSIRKKSEFESEIQSLMKLRGKNDEFIKQLYRQAYHLGAIFHLTKFKTEELEDKIAEVRRKFKGREEFLKRLIRSEVTNGMMIQKKLYSIQEEQILERQDFMEKKAMYTLALAELETPLLELEEDAAKIRTAHKEHADTLNDIIEKRQHVKRNVERTKKNLRKKGKKTRDAIIETEEKRSMIFKEIKTTKSKTVIYHAKIDQLNKDLEEKEKEKNILAQTLEQLKNHYITIKYKKEYAQAVFDQLVSEKKTCEERLYEEEQRYRTLITMRQKTLADIKKIQDDSLEENLRLAQEYQELQTTFLTEKDNYFNLYDRQLSLDASIQAKKQLCQLQRRIHKVWQNHFKLVVLCGQMRLAKFQTDSQESIQKILAVQALQMPFSCLRDTVNNCLVLLLCETSFSEKDTYVYFI
ncbi:coiled-coil domain-containing protein 178 isoform X1 [Panthera tigris]|uniref:coiled-coil domain-containing protein 178 isoform X1 n=1 Tax=Panthera tigris TaxID=9694 RepID=UPI001C6F9BA8|nr:coiled-coil domain-containing protein 178 isoform X1 [Panthera tigris]XP_042818601.1 coiled-coil domain-containing protein 178 isoform X1 [Panthera tigris]XP_042818602.1 coiled-coil domain-containing protein 178 isoform X1 [Panthera tigris]XP_042818603.1 coiled-coil domain-containing protein 178 isoform X1 [Panthera tigris]XP_042818604.1 coiled-coil domain-containing protein 178 isoform X1 [Panthera tigris]XP_042818605.1 coiled-coil domain-containing protein 178 isoform X1 [Panthera tigris]